MNTLRTLEGWFSWMTEELFMEIYIGLTAVVLLILGLWLLYCVCGLLLSFWDVWRRNKTEQKSMRAMGLHVNQKEGEETGIPYLRLL